MGSLGIKLEQPIGLAVLDYDEYYDSKSWYITRINVPVPHRGKGLGTQLLDKLLKMADTEGKNVWLEISPSDGLSYEELEAWYFRHGFKGNMIYRRRPIKVGE